MKMFIFVDIENDHATIGAVDFPMNVVIQKFSESAVFTGIF